MNNQVRVALAILAMAALACGLIPSGSGGEPAPAAPAAPEQLSPTPPAIPTVPLITPTSIAPSEVQAAPPTVSPDKVVSIIYGASRDGSMALYFLTLDGRFSGKLDLQDETITHAIWPDVSPDGSKIAFVSVQSSMLSNGIYIADIDGSNVLQVTVGDGTYPKWSPDGARLAYACNGGTDICTINMDGQNMVNLTQDVEAVDTYPAWTRDGRIVFMSARDLPEDGRFSEIYIMDADGSNVSALTNDGDAYNAHPSVSPDGTRVAFESDRDVGIGSEIYIMEIDGTNQVRITNDTAWNQNPVWSPDGNVILYAANYGDGNIDLYFINSDGSNRIRLTQDPGEDGGYRWGHAWLPVEYIPASLEVEYDPERAPEPPQGTEAVTNAIIFAANSFNCPDCLETGIYTVGFDGSNLTRLAVDGFYPTWDTRFQRILFVQNGELFMANADGSEPVQMTRAFRGLYGPLWSPGGDKILAGCTPYGQHDVCLIDPQTGAINNLLEEITFGLGIPYPSWYNVESILVGALQIDLGGTVISSVPFGGRVSPMGDRLATALDRQIVTMNLDGTGQEKLTDDAPTKGFPVWSPDGQLIIYSIAPGDGRIYLYIIQVDGTNPRPLVAPPIAAGPTTRPDVLETFFGYNWAP